MSTLERLSYTEAEVAEVTGLSPDTVKRARATGTLRAKRTSSAGGRYVYLAADVQAWLASLPDG